MPSMTTDTTSVAKPTHRACDECSTLAQTVLPHTTTDRSKGQENLHVRKIKMDVIAASERIFPVATLSKNRKVWSYIRGCEPSQD
jgi:hypothetical protein